ncbi:hypothetical protein AQUCO_02100007v1 [Aquilegia coerulea]|uniref:DUF2828 domain-containing protein n=1 Tax=Aquilegia coerulea TaxID=218851 RepID=A0A2G5DEE5_AQUCA|nr:hypothetical protein AQUCO_02100007v1 [Aquilegia coerulea]
MATTASGQLLGPPELHGQQTHNKKPTSSSSSGSGDPFMDLMVANFNNTTTTKLLIQQTVPVPVPPRGFTENLSPTFLSTGNPCLDFVFHIGFYTAALWLHKHHLKTLACNVKSISKFGYFKDLPEILYRILQGSNVRKLGKDEFERRKKQNIPMGNKSLIPREERLAIEMKKVKIQVETARDIRKEKETAKARKAFERYTHDPNFRFLHDQISQVFADHLVDDLKSLKCGEIGKIILLIKVFFFVKVLLIARRVFPHSSCPEYEGIEEAHYPFRVRDRLRKEVLVPLRQILELPELYMSSNKWNSLPYGRVPSIAMTNYKKHFLKHNQERFNEFLGKVKCGEAKIAAGALFPHEIIKHLDDGEEDAGQVAELQWKRIVDDLSAKGKLKNCIAVSDVSGSMSGTPMEVSIALGLLLSELCEDPWKGKVITFSADPKLNCIEGDDLQTKTQSIQYMDAGFNTNFQKVFDQILQVAVAGKLSADKMIKRVFVFSDIEFDAANGKKKFQDSGYSIPEIVFWNLRDSKATPVASDQKELMTLFLDKEDVPGPEAVMNLALRGPEYEQLFVLD